ncbi:MAG TPA: Rieske 2Fe-2S domain-containing protein [Nitrososphaerales archaeon]|nr:Rieske 2Fe-2S domain-containing protein [Nitrososphaerales archaeon]
MDSVKVGEISEFDELVPKVIILGEARVFVYLHRGKFYAYADKCPHQGGPACEGDVRGRVIGSVNKKSLYFESVSKDQYSIVCPWHGVEYDLQSGMCRTDRRMRLRSYEVLVEGKDVLLKK